MSYSQNYSQQQRYPAAFGGTEYDIFLSYRREGGETMAILLRDRLVAKGYRVFLDVESLNSGSFNTKLLAVIERCTDFILVLSKDSLDRCVNEGDWVRREIAHAFATNKNIVPIMLRGFDWPEHLPYEISELPMRNAVNASNNEYFDAAIDRLTDRFLLSRPIAQMQAAAPFSKNTPPSAKSEKSLGKKSLLAIMGISCAVLLAAILTIVLTSNNSSPTNNGSFISGESPTPNIVITPPATAAPDTPTGNGDGELGENIDNQDTGDTENTTSPQYSTTQPQSATEIVYRGIALNIHGQSIILRDNDGQAQEPVILYDTIYAPAVSLARALGHTASYDAAANTLTVSSFPDTSVIGGTDPVQLITLNPMFSISGGFGQVFIDDVFTETYWKQYEDRCVAGNLYTGLRSTVADGFLQGASYRLDGNYSRFTGEIYVTLEGTAGQSIFSVFGDEKRLYTSPAITNGNYPLAFDVDIVGVDILTVFFSDGITFDSNSHSTLRNLGITNGILHRLPVASLTPVNTIRQVNTANIAAVVANGNALNLGINEAVLIDGVAYVPVVGFADSLSLSADFDQAASIVYISNSSGIPTSLASVASTSLFTTHSFIISTASRLHLNAFTGIDYEPGFTEFYLNGEYTRLEATIINAFVRGSRAEDRTAGMRIWADGRLVYEIEVNRQWLNPPADISIDLTGVETLRIQLVSLRTQLGSIVNPIYFAHATLYKDP